MGKIRKLGRGVAVVGAGMSRFGLLRDRDTMDHFAGAYLAMARTVDRGLDPERIDALYVGNFSGDFFARQAHWGPILADLLGLVPKPATRIEGACASSALAFREGVFAIASGCYDVVLAGGVEHMSDRTTEEVAEGLALATFPDEGMAGFTFPGVFAAIATAYCHRYGAGREDLMNVTIKSHDNARLNPKAQFQSSIREIMDGRVARARALGQPLPQWQDEKGFLGDPSVNPVVAWPMHLYDCCPISDGASCVLLAAEAVAREFTDDPLHVVGVGQGSGRGLSSCPDLTAFEATRQAAAEAYGMSGLSPAEVQFAEVHDCFSIAEIVHLEDLGFFAAGKGFRAVNEGLTRLDGPKPINTSGGLKCKGHPVGATGTSQICELWEQLRGTAGPRQIPHGNLRIGAAHNLGGTGGTCTLTLLERR